MGSRFESPAHLSVGYHISESESRSVVSDSLQPHELCSPWNSPVQNTGVGSLFLLQGSFPTQGLNLCLLHWAGGFFHTEPPGKPQFIYIQIFIQLYMLLFSG